MSQPRMRANKQKTQNFYHPETLSSFSDKLKSEAFKWLQKPRPLNWKSHRIKNFLVGFHFCGRNFQFRPNGIILLLKDRGRDLLAFVSSSAFIERMP